MDCCPETVEKRLPADFADRLIARIRARRRRERRAKVLAANGRGSDALMRLCGIQDYPARKLMSAAARVSQHFCDQAVLLCAETDYQLKTSYDEQERLLELLLLQLAEEARHD